MIRALETGDRPRILEIYDRAAAKSAFSIGARWREDDFTDELAHAKGWVWLEGQVPVGFIFCRFQPDSVEVTQLAVDPAHWGRKVGLRMLEAVLAAHPGPAWLEVHERNKPAQRVYEAAGFKKTGERKRYYRDGGTAWLYTKT
ncbi:MAG TPA: GNAT family N-acetyltransferase [Bdellovibrionales bacterium]|nr:GNAT family N-acetyltransferase [Bdellovibrionales bacterium]